MTEKERLKVELMSFVKLQSPSKPTGGQTCSTPFTGVHFVLEELEFEIKVKTFRSQLKNAEKALLLIELFIDDYLDSLYKS